MTRRGNRKRTIPERTIRERTVRRGFTLVELLVVISIIAVLASLITVAVQSAMRTAKVALVKVEISSMEAAIAAFKANYKADVPSSLTIHTTPANWNDDPISKSKIRSIWPQFDFTTNGGWTSETVSLSGGECLMFFLGGITDGGVPKGFSRNASKPFSKTSPNRIGPFMEFDTSRVVQKLDDYENPRPNVYVYVDPLRSQLPGYGYLRHEDYSTGGYRQPTTTTSYWKAQSYQIVSPGFDGKFGSGIYDSSGSSTSVGTNGKDDITNFSTGMLAP